MESQNETLAEDEKMRSADGYGTFTIAFPHQGQVRTGWHLNLVPCLSVTKYKAHVVLEHDPSIDW